MSNEKRHGDLQIQKTSMKKIPAGWEAQKPNGRGVVLAEGEHTGHAHVIAAVAIAVLYRKAQEEYALLHVQDAAVPLDHEEHNRQMYEPGIHRVGQKRQYEDDGTWSPVAD